MNAAYSKILFATMFLGLSINAWATPPLSETVYYDDEFPLVGCGDFDVRVLATTRERQTLFFDKEGNEVRLRIALHVSDAIYYNSSNPDLYIQQGASGTGENLMIMIDLKTGTERYSGAPYRITIPGVGPLYIEAGHWTWDGENFVSKGVFMFPEEGTGSALCDALSP